VGTVLDILEDRGTESEFTSLLQTASDEVWGHLALRHALSDSGGEFRARLLREKKALAATGQAADKLRLRLELAEAGEYYDPNGIVALAFEGRPWIIVRNIQCCHGWQRCTRTSFHV
jgi:hypothetical protein